MSEPERPRPQYGEYASPEDQRAHIRDPQANPHYVPPDAGAEQQADRSRRESAAQRPGATDAGSADASSTNASDASRRPPHAAGSRARVRPWDRVLTWVLLAVGLLNLALSVSSYLNMAPTLDAAYSQLGIGDFGASDVAAPAGVALVIVQAVIWVVAAALASLSLRRGRLSFWIPLVGAVVSYVSLVAILLVVVLNDPAFTEFMTRAGV